MPIARLTEYAAALLILTGLYAGSTTLTGASCYAVGCAIAAVFTWRAKLQGLTFLNSVSVLVALINIARLYGR